MLFFDLLFLEVLTCHLWFFSLYMCILNKHNYQRIDHVTSGILFFLASSFLKKRLGMAVVWLWLLNWLKAAIRWAGEMRAQSLYVIEYKLVQMGKAWECEKYVEIKFICNWICGNLAKKKDNSWWSRQLIVKNNICWKYVFI